MSVALPADPKHKESSLTKLPVKCRIPQRLPLNKNRPHLSASYMKNKRNYHDPDVGAQPRYPTKVKDDANSGKPQSARTNRAPLYQSTNIKKPSVIPRRLRETSITKNGRPLITVPVTHGKDSKRHQDLEMRQSAVAVYAANLEEEDPFIHSSHSEELIHLKMLWQEKIIVFEKMKSELKERQKDILELYAKMRGLHTKMSALGDETSLPAAEDLNVMNVSNLSPEKLLELCTEYHNLGDGQKVDVTKVPLAMDVNKLFNLPNKLIETCDQTLKKRQDIIDWFSNLITKDKGIRMTMLTKKIEEFNGENDMLKGTLEQVKIDYLKDLEDIIKFMRKTTAETIALQLRTEDLIFEITELNSQNLDLRKQILNLENIRSLTAKTKLEEMEKELKEEKCKKALLRERLNRAEGQSKLNGDRASQLDAALQQAQAQQWQLEQNVKSLQGQNQKLQNDFEKELNILTESIRGHTENLKAIAADREKLQDQKEELEYKIVKLSSYYEETISNANNDIAKKEQMLSELQSKYESTEDAKKSLDARVDSLCVELFETSSLLKNSLQLLEDKEAQIETLKTTEIELKKTIEQLRASVSELQESKLENKKQNESYLYLEKLYKESLSLQEAFKNELGVKTNCISEQDKKIQLLEEQLKQNETKMEEYIKQLTTLKTHISQLQMDFGDFENLNELHEIVKQQRTNLANVTKENKELIKELQQKREELEQTTSDLMEQQQMLDTREKTIQMLTDKDKEHTNIIQILRNNLELRSQADNELTQQITEKDNEIQNLISMTDTRKQQISNLEKIILTLESQNKKITSQSKKDQEKISMLQKKIDEFETYQMDLMYTNDNENFDALIKRIEEELKIPLDIQPIPKAALDVRSRLYRDRKRKDDNVSIPPPACNSFSGEPKVKHTPRTRCNDKMYPHDGDEGRYQGDNLDCKPDINQIEKHWGLGESKSNIYNLLCNQDDLLETQLNSRTYFTRNFTILPHSGVRHERKFQMLKKLAGHRI